MQIDLDTGEILEDGSDEELAEWVQLYRATRDTLDALRTPRRDLPLLGAGDTPQAGRPAGGAPRHSGAPHGVHPRCVAREPPAGASHTGGPMKLIIAGSRTFTDYQRLCQVLAPDRHRITQVLTGGAPGR